MDSQNQLLDSFFQTYEQNTAAGDMQAVAAHFADVFLAAGPQGAKAVPASEFALAVSKKKELFDRLGRYSTSLVSLEKTQLSGRYAMVTTEWCLSFARPGMETEQIAAGSVFIVDTGCDPCKIVFYLANQDLMEVLQQRGIAAG